MSSMNLVRILDLKLKYLFLFIWVIANLVSLFYVVYSSESVARSARLGQLEEQIHQLRLENMTLENEIASYSAIRSISDRAKANGLKDMGVSYMR
jgi:cell division protein FtsL